MNWRAYELMDKHHSMDDIDSFFDEISEYGDFSTVIKDGIEYYNAPCSFDIETSSFLDIHSGEKRACMYIWQLGINGSVLYGRTWYEFMDVLSRLMDFFSLNDTCRLVIYIHNLSYEFAFMRSWFQWDKVFALKNRRPVYAICGGFEFRCSYFLSNRSLAHVGEELLQKYPMKKLVGDLDYSKVRSSITPLSDSELEYCFNDVRVVMCYIQEKIESEGGIQNIPLTNTGYVRNFCREQCYYEDFTNRNDRRRCRNSYMKLMRSLQISGKDEYQQLQRAFMGGFTHASLLWSGQTIRAKSWGPISSNDIASSYPYAMISSYFPMGPATFIGDVHDGKSFQYYLQKFCCVFDIEFINLQPSTDFEHIISSHKCDFPDGTNSYTVNNGRVISASRLITTLTELDFDTICKFYHWDSIKITNLRIYERGHLPRALILAILDLYEKKTTLKGVKGKEVEYMVAKNMINSVYGMMVTAIVRAEYTYDGDNWVKEVPEYDTAISKYNSSINRFQFYAWGIYVTAHARHNLFEAIWELQEDYIYADTDSVKYINKDKHEQFFKNYNNRVFNRLLTVSNELEIPFSKFQPVTSKGVKKLMGVFEDEEPYEIFKTSGAKQYIYKYPDGTYNLTISGVNKKWAMPYLLYTKSDGSHYDNTCRNFLIEHKIPLTEEPPFIRLARLAYGAESYSTPELSALGVQTICKNQLISFKLQEGFIFLDFGDGLYFPPEHSGSINMTYIDYPTTGLVYDYLGNPYVYKEYTSVHMEAGSYRISKDKQYLDLLEGVEDGSI